MKEYGKGFKLDGRGLKLSGSGGLKCDGILPWGKGAGQIETPYDPEARWSRKGDERWLSDKLQVTETEDAYKPHLITDIVLTPSVEYDYLAPTPIRERQKKREALSAERWADKGYIDAPAIEVGRTVGEDLIGPTRGASIRSRDGRIVSPTQIPLVSHAARPAV